MRIRPSALLVVVSLAAVSAWAQETRGNINGTVQDSSGVVPGATITVTNVDTGQTQRLVTNNSGYFEAPLFQPTKRTSGNWRTRRRDGSGRWPVRVMPCGPTTIRTCGSPE